MIMQFQGKKPDLTRPLNTNNHHIIVDHKLYIYDPLSIYCPNIVSDYTHSTLFCALFGTLLLYILYTFLVDPLLHFLYTFFVHFIC